MELKELTEFIGAADLYVTPYLEEAQITSGTLAYAFGAGKAVISTPYWHAAELLSDQRGVLVPFADPRAIACEVSALLRDDRRRKTMSDRAYRLGRAMVWSNTAELYMRSFQMARKQRSAVPGEPVVASAIGHRPHESPELNLRHLYHMTNSTVIFQHAKIAANHAESSCADDNARALILAVQLGNLEDTPMRVRSLATTDAAFLGYAFNPKMGRLHNFLSVDRQSLDEQRSEDCQGRAICALGTAVGGSPHWSSQTKAEQLFALTHVTSPRAWAFSLIGIDEYLRQKDDRVAIDTRQELTRRLMTIFDKVGGSCWTWFEDGLAYDNARLAHALIVSGHATGQKDVYERGIEVLRRLVGVQNSRPRKLRPIGSNGFYRRNGVRADYDQPIEAHATISAYLEAYRATFDPWWYEQAQRAFERFLCWNDLGGELDCPQTGGCRARLHPDRSNQNQGAESGAGLSPLADGVRQIQNSAGTVQRTGLAVSLAQ